MKLIKLISLLFIISIPVYAQNQNKQWSDFGAILDKKEPYNVKVDAYSLAKCSAFYYAVSMHIDRSGKLMSELLYMLALSKNKSIALNTYDKEKEKYLSIFSNRKTKHNAQKGDIFCAKVGFKSNRELEKIAQKTPEKVEAKNIEGMWIDYYAKWENI